MLAHATGSRRAAGVWVRALRRIHSGLNGPVGSIRTRGRTTRRARGRSRCEAVRQADGHTRRTAIGRTCSRALAKRVHSVRAPSAVRASYQATARHLQRAPSPVAAVSQDLLVAAGDRIVAQPLRGDRQSRRCGNHHHGLRTELRNVGLGNIFIYPALSNFGEGLRGK